MRVDKHLRFKTRRHVVLFDKKVAEQPHARCKALRARIVGKQFQQFVLEHGHTPWFQSDKSKRNVLWIVTGEFRRKRCEDGFELFACGVEVAEVIKRAAAAQRFSRQYRFKTRVPKHLDGGQSDLRMEVLAEGIDPQDHLAAQRCCGFIKRVIQADLGEARAKRLRCKPR